MSAAGWSDMQYETAEESIQNAASVCTTLLLLQRQEAATSLAHLLSAVELNLRLPAMLHGKRGFERIVYAFKHVLNHSLSWLFIDLDALDEPTTGTPQIPLPILRHAQEDLLLQCLDGHTHTHAKQVQ